MWKRKEWFFFIFDVGDELDMKVDIGLDFFLIIDLNLRFSNNELVDIDDFFELLLYSFLFRRESMIGSEYFWLCDRVYLFLFFLVDSDGFDVMLFLIDELIFIGSIFIINEFLNVFFLLKFGLVLFLVFGS